MATISASAMADLAPMRDFLDEVNTKCGLHVDSKSMDQIALALHQNNVGLVRDLKTLSADWMEALGMPTQLAQSVLQCFEMAKRAKAAGGGAGGAAAPVVIPKPVIPVALPVHQKVPEQPIGSGVAAFALIADEEPAAPGGFGRGSISHTPNKPAGSPQPALIASPPVNPPLMYIAPPQHPYSQPRVAIAANTPIGSGGGVVDPPPPYQASGSDAGDAFDALNVGPPGGVGGNQRVVTPQPTPASAPPAAAASAAVVAPPTPIVPPVIEKSDPLLNALKNAVSHISSSAAQNNYMMKGLQNLLTASTAYGDGKQLVLTDCVKQAEQCAQLWYDLTTLAIEENNRAAAASAASASATSAAAPPSHYQQPVISNVPHLPPIDRKTVTPPLSNPGSSSTAPPPFIPSNGQAAATVGTDLKTPPAPVSSIVSPPPSKPVWMPEPCIVCRKPVSGPKEYLECSHSGCAACLNKYINDAVAANRAVGMKCPKDGCGATINEHTVQCLLLPAEFAKYLDSTVNAFLDQDVNSCKCPNPKCGQRLTMKDPGSGAAALKKGPVTEKDEQGRVLSEDAYKHFMDYRIRCPNCNINFCTQCKLTPYHKGYTCQTWEVYTKSRQCRYCHAKMDSKNTCPNPPSQAVRDCCTSSECLDKQKLSCLKMKECGCPCPGIRDEKECLPCLKCDLKKAEDFCAICYVEALADAPCIQLTSCKHIYHASCVKSKITAGYNGARITFGFMECPQDKKPMEHPGVVECSKNFLALRAVIQGKAMERLKYECREKDPQIMKPDSPYYNNPPAFAMHQYLFFMCYKCQKPYFAGGYACQEASAGFDPKDLICGSCQPKAENMKECKVHGSDWIAFKCRYCCQFANFFCWSKTHFCDTCHKPGTWTNLSTMTTGANKKQIWEYPQCESLKGPIAAIQNNYSLNEKQKEEAFSKLRADPKQCPVGMRHPPNGFEFGLGCSMCADKDSEDENKHAAAKAKMEEAERKQYNPLFLKTLSSKEGRVFKYNQVDFDTGGVLYGIGSYGGASGAHWSNPADHGDIKISCSSLAKDSKPLQSLFAREHVRIATDNKSDSWIGFDLVDKYLSPTFYTLKVPTTAGSECLKSWRLEASGTALDSKSGSFATWDTLKVHSNDSKLSDKEKLSVQGPTVTFPISSSASKRYRSFRIVMTGKNTGNTFVLALSGIELYGTLYANR